MKSEFTKLSCLAIPFNMKVCFLRLFLLNVGKQKLITILLAEIIIITPSISKGECCFQIFEKSGMLLPKMQYLKHLWYPGGKGENKF